MSVFNYQKDDHGIVTVTMDMTGPVNSMNAEYEQAMEETVARLEADLEAGSGPIGVIFASAKKVFFAGGNLDDLLAFEIGQEAEFMAMLTRVKSQLRRLEALPVPVVAAINGAALGGGLEVALACNYRIAVDHKSVQLGLPEVTLGLLPGGGGVVRMVNLLGLEQALPYLLEGKKVDAPAAVKAGIIHESVASHDELLPRATAWILDNHDKADAAVQPWDRKGFKIPGGSANSPKMAQLMVMAPTMVEKKTRGLLPAPIEILNCAVEAARLDFETALRIESRGFTRLVGTPEAKNMITTFFFQLNEVNGGASRPTGPAKTAVKKLGILGAGMMGQGIAYVAAKAGIDVVLKDVTVEAAEKGKAYAEPLLDKAVSRGRMTPAGKREVLDRITPTDSLGDLAGCDLLVEAVFENIELKHAITREVEPTLPATCVWGTNTSSLPITELAEASARPENFIGIHFFSPVDKMPLIEIICGEKTSDDALARAFDFAQQIRKTPIVVNDSLAFFTSRTFGTYLDEGVRLLTEGVHPIRIDNLGKAVGMPVGPLQVHDEVSLELTRKAGETWSAMGVAEKWGERQAMTEVINYMVGENQRGGRHHGGGFYDYDGKQRQLWAPLLDRYYKPDTAITDDDVKDRLLFRQVIETLKCLETGVLRSVADGNIGSIMGIGAPVHTGGFIQFVNSYGVQKFVDRCGELADRYGERFDAPKIARDKAAANETFA